MFLIDKKWSRESHLLEQNRNLPRSWFGMFPLKPRRKNSENSLGHLVNSRQFVCLRSYPVLDLIEDLHLLISSQNKMPRSVKRRCHFGETSVVQWSVKFFCSNGCATVDKSNAMDLWIANGDFNTFPEGIQITVYKYSFIRTAFGLGMGR